MKLSTEPLNITTKRAERTWRGKEKAKAERRSAHIEKTRLAKFRRMGLLNDLQRYLDEFGEFTYPNILKKWLPPNISFITSSKKSDFYIDFDKIRVRHRKGGNTFDVPAVFSLIDNPKESYGFIRNVVVSLLCERFKILTLNYHSCTKLDIGAQVFLDVILKDIFAFYERCFSHPRVEKKVGITKQSVDIFQPSTTPEFVKKILYSVGGFAIHQNKQIHFSDIIPYPLCVHNRAGKSSSAKASEQKDIDTTTLADYVIDSLKKMNKTLTSEKREALCVIIGEVLINAEEHATTKHRFSIGYFQDYENDGKHSGLFRLVIMNFGRTIYEKFNDPKCPNKPIVEKMKQLSNRYTEKNFFSVQEFQEETLWTLYALQEGITSVADAKRGHGSIQFIDSFFNLNGEQNFIDGESRMTILSGKTNITFDGKYGIVNRDVGQEKLKVMTFNANGDIEEKPDKANVRFVDNYFPGTIISARIVFDEEDFTI